MTWLLVSLVLAGVQSPSSCTESDEHGNSFAVCFDPWTGLELGGGIATDGTGAAGSAVASLRLRGERESNSKAESTWLSLHRIASVELFDVQGSLSGSATAYSGLFRRHVREGVMLLAFDPPVRVPFPLDISLMGDLLRFERRQREGSDWSLELTRFSVLFDPLRSPSSRFHLGLGITAAWKLIHRDDVPLHEVTPLTAATVFFDIESEDGLWATRGILTGGYTFTTPDATLQLRAKADVEVLRVLFAVNDMPVSLYARGTAAYRDAGARESTEWTAQLGLQVRLFSRRPSPQGENALSSAAHTVVRR